MRRVDRLVSKPMAGAINAFHRPSCDLLNALASLRRLRSITTMFAARKVVAIDPNRLLVSLSPRKRDG